MGTKLNKKNEKRKNIHRIIAGTRYKKERNRPSPQPLRHRKGIITEIPARMMTKLRHNDIGTYLIIAVR